MTSAELEVSKALPAYWVWNYPITLGKKQEGYPTNYKLDFANPTKKIGLEVDGSSHTMTARKEQDVKKEAKLGELGWRVFRISNAQVQQMCSTSKLTEFLISLLGTEY
jgi:very-short-patch-repair endonuclease